MAAINVSAELHEQLQKIATSQGKSLTAVASEAIEAGLNPPVVEPREDFSLEEAGELLMKHLPVGMFATVTRLCEQKGRKPIEYLLGYCRLAHERGETSHFRADRSLQSAVAVEWKPETTECEYCRKPFMPARFGQKYCPDPPADSAEESCGRKAHIQFLRARRPVTPTKERAAVMAVAAPKALV